MIIYLLSDNKEKSFSSGDHLWIIWWSSVIYLVTNKQTDKKPNKHTKNQTNKQTKLIIWWNWWSCVTYLMIICYLSGKKQTNIAYHLVIVRWPLDDHLFIIWQQTKKLIIWWSSNDCLMIICYMTTNKHTNKQTIKQKNWWSSVHYLMIFCYLSGNKQTN